MTRLLTLVPLLGLLLVSPALAVEFHHDGPAFVPVHNCTCRFNGEEVPLGQRRCLRTAVGPRTAECVLEQNVTSWRAGPEACPQASLLPRHG